MKTPMTKLTASEAFGLCMNSPIFQKRRRSENELDFGDVQTVGHQLTSDDRMGIYLGEHTINGSPAWVVLEVDVFWKNTGGEAYADLNELKRTWKLD